MVITFVLIVVLGPSFESLTGGGVISTGGGLVLFGGSLAIGVAIMGRLTGVQGAGQWTVVVLLTLVGFVVIAPIVLLFLIGLGGGG